MIFSNYHSGDITWIASQAFDGELRLYIEYLRKKDNLLRAMIVRPTAIYTTHIMVVDDDTGGIKRLNVERIKRIGIEANA